MMKTKAILSLFFCLGLISCGGLKPGASNSAKTLYENFFVGAEGSMYFIKPLALKSEEKLDGNIDFTFTNANLDNDTAIVNLDYVVKSKSAPVQLSLVSAGIKADLSITEQFYIERYGEGFKYRYSATGALKDINALFASGSFALVVTCENGQHYEYEATKKSKKSINKLQYGVFALLD